MVRAFTMGCNPTADFWRRASQTGPAPQVARLAGCKKKGRRETALGYGSHGTALSGAHDLSAGGTVLDHSFSTPPLGGALFCGCHSAASAFLCHMESFLFCVLMFIVAQHIVRRVDSCPWGVTLP